MSEENKNQNYIHEEQDFAQLREEVLSWINQHEKEESEKKEKVKKKLVKKLIKKKPVKDLAKKLPTVKPVAKKTTEELPKQVNQNKKFSNIFKRKQKIVKPKSKPIKNILPKTKPPKPKININPLPQPKLVENANPTKKINPDVIPANQFKPNYKPNPVIRIKKSRQKIKSIKVPRIPSKPSNVKMLPSGEHLKFVNKTVKITTGLLLYSFTVILLLAFIFSISVYGFQSRDVVTRSMSSVFPYPALVINGNLILYSEYLDAYDSLEKINNIQSSENTPDQIRKNTINKLINEEILYQLARKNKIGVSDGELSNFLDRLIKEAGSESALIIYLKNQGYSADTFMQDVVKPYLLRLKLNAAYQNASRANEETFNRAIEVASTIKNNRDNIESEVQKYNQNPHYSVTIGYYYPEQVASLFGQDVLNMKSGEVSNPIKQNSSYQVIGITEIIEETIMRGSDITDEQNEELTYKETIYKIVKVTIRPDIDIENIITQEREKSGTIYFIH